MPADSATTGYSRDGLGRHDRADPSHASRRPIPVISIGNLALGGRGKTPLVAFVTELLLAAGERPAILTRGYHRRHRDDGVVVVSDGQTILRDVDRSGDEPLMLAESLPGASVLVSETRVVAAALAERILGATVIVLDDGFQHRALARDVDVVLVGPDDLKSRRIPFGSLREGLSSLARADAVILDADPDVPWPESHHVSSAPRFRLTRSLGPALPVDRSQMLDRAKPILAVAGIASPDRFRRMLETAGWTLSRFLTFRDHHRFTPSDTEAIVKSARDTGAHAVVTTAKDAVRLRGVGTFSVPLFVMPLRVTVEPAEGFQSWLSDRLGRARTVKR